MRIVRPLLAVFAALSLSACGAGSGARLDPNQPRGPSILVVVAHPDDESAMAAALYRIAVELHGTVDELVLTNGEGGFRYSTLAEPYYGLHLTDEAVGRVRLPAIREEELRRATHLLGVRELVFLRQQDLRYTKDAAEPLTQLWDVPAIGRALDAQLAAHHYDAVFGLLTVPETHGHHKAATILALRAVARLPAGSRPLVFGVTTSKPDAEPPAYAALPEYPETAPLAEAPWFSFDRDHHFGFQDKLSYQTIVNWEIAEHKSQGTMQLAVGQYRWERFRLFAGADAGAVVRATDLFTRLSPWSVGAVPAPAPAQVGK